jgi:hypothetical protein
MVTAPFGRALADARSADYCRLIADGAAKNVARVSSGDSVTGKPECISCMNESSVGSLTEAILLKPKAIGYQRPAPSFSEKAVNASSICAAAGGFSI